MRFYLTKKSAETMTDSERRAWRRQHKPTNKETSIPFLCSSATTWNKVRNKDHLNSCV